MSGDNQAGQHDAPAQDGPEVGVVVIGRNEGERLVRALDAALAQCPRVVYVDSGSTDRSVEEARRRGVEVVALDLSVPFTAARARHAGWERMVRLHPQVDYVQFIDGDCELIDGWLDAGAACLSADGAVAIVCGKTMERCPEASVYNRLASMEWKALPGESHSCGGNLMVRCTAYDEVGGFNHALICGEEPELCLRLRRRGAKIMRLDRDMVWHDAAMTRFSQWWTRSTRSGWQIAEGVARYGRGPERYCVWRALRVLFYAMVLPTVALGLAWPTLGISLALFALYPLAGWKIFRDRRRRLGDDGPDARRYAFFCVLAKWPECWGMMKYAAARVARRQAVLIEYKAAAAGESNA